MEKKSKVMWEVETSCRETIKPATPTPPHLRTYKLSWLDLLLHRDHVAFVLFYPKPCDPNSLSTLKTSLSQTLAIFYPLAGRLNPDGTSVDCNDEGVSFFEARAIAHAPLSRLVSDPDVIGSIDSLLPCTHHCLRKCSDGPLLCVQVTTFSPCGGIAIGCCISHNIGDGHSAGMFIDAWAANTRDGTTIHNTPLFDAASYFVPPSDDKGRDELMALKGVPPQEQEQEQARQVTKVFLFKDLPSIIKLKESSSVPGLTRVQAVTALIWRCCMRLKEITAGSSTDKCSYSAIALIAANMRGKGRGLPDNLFGNLYDMVAAWDRIVVDKMRSEERINTAIRSLDEEKVRGYQGTGGWSLMLGSLSDGVKRVEEETDAQVAAVYMFSSWTRFDPLYEADFGWGRPVWMAPGGPFTDRVFALTARSGVGEGGGGGGIEAWVTLEEEEMRRFERDEEIKMYASFV